MKKLKSTLLLITILMLMLPLINFSIVFSQDNHNTITFDNQSGEFATVKVIGPTNKTVEVYNGQKQTVSIQSGTYYILTRYGTKPNEYNYIKGDTFTVSETSSQYSDVLITLHKVIGGNYHSHSIDEEEFNNALIDEEKTSTLNSNYISGQTRLNQEDKENQATKFKTTIYEYSKPNWSELADEILKPFGGINKFISKNNKGNTYVWQDPPLSYLGQTEKDAIIAKVPDFLERLNALYKEKLFSTDLIKNKDIVEGIYIHHSWKDIYTWTNTYVPHSEILNYFELVKGKSTKKLLLSEIKEIKIYTPLRCKIQEGDRAFDQDVDEFYSKEGYYGMSLAIAELWDGTIFKEAIKVIDRKVKGKTYFGDFETSLDTEKYASLKFVFEYTSDKIK